MTILAVETSTFSGSVALINNNQIVAHEAWAREGSHSEFLTLAVETLLKKNNFSLKQLSRLAVGLGPGSFTGIRVGVNFIRTLSYALQLPVYGLDSLQLLAFGAAAAATKINLPIQTMQYAFRDFCYTSLYEVDGQTLSLPRLKLTFGPKIMTFAEIKASVKNPVLAVGSGAKMIFDSLSESTLNNFIREKNISDTPDAKNFIFSAVLDQSPSELTDWIHTIPIYIRASEAEEKLKILSN